MPYQNLDYALRNGPNWAGLNQAMGGTADALAAQQKQQDDLKQKVQLYLFQKQMEQQFSQQKFQQDLQNQQATFGQNLANYQKYAPMFNGQDGQQGGSQGMPQQTPPPSLQQVIGQMPQSQQPAMSMPNGGVGTASGQPFDLGSALAKLQGGQQGQPSMGQPPMQGQPQQRQQNPMILNPNSAFTGKFNMMKNPSYKAPEQSLLGGIDFSSIPTPKSPQERDAILNNLPPEISENIKSVGNYDMDINKMTSLRRGSEDRLKFDALVSRMYPDMMGEQGFNSAEYANRQNFKKSFFDPNKPTGTAVNAIKQVTYHLGDLHDNVTQLINAGSPILNKPLNWWQKNAAGNGQLSSVITDITAVNEELTKAWAGNNNGAERVREWQKSLNTANSPEQWKAVMSTASNLLDGAVKTRQSQYKATMKRDIDLLDPDQRQILDSLKSTYSGNDSSGGQGLNGKTQSGLTYTISQ